jgi:hypothetical protein
VNPGPVPRHTIAEDRMANLKRTTRCRRCASCGRLANDAHVCAPRTTVADRFWPKVDRRGPDECWPWTGAYIRKGGYGAFNCGPPTYRVTQAQRVAWELTNGPTTDSLFVLQECGNRPCCNPAHLFLGAAAKADLCQPCSRFVGAGHVCPSPAERFWRYVERGDAEACWPWKELSRHEFGYGISYALGVPGQRAHRVSWQLAYGPIPDGLHVCHRCDNPPCVNPAHLFLGTNADNVADKIAKGRWRVGPRPDAKP